MQITRAEQSITVEQLATALYLHLHPDLMEIETEEQRQQAAQVVASYLARFDYLEALRCRTRPRHTGLRYPPASSFTFGPWRMELNGYEDVLYDNLVERVVLTLEQDAPLLTTPSMRVQVAENAITLLYANTMDGLQKYAATADEAVSLTGPRLPAPSHPLT